MYNPKSKDLDREYFPSYHTTRFQDQPEPNMAVQEHFIGLTKQHERDLTEKQGISVDHLRYGGGRRLVDVFYNESTTNQAPLFVFVHGGYWQMLDKSTSCSIVGPLVRRGYRVAVMDYNLCPDVTLETLMKEFAGFINWIFDYAELTNVLEITFAGHSAGAHLLAQILQSQVGINPQRSKKVWALVLLCGVYDLRELYNLESVNPKNILGLTERNVQAVSPMLWEYTDVVIWNSTKIYVVAAEHDSTTFIEQSRRFAELLKKTGFRASFKLFPKYDHFDIIEETAIDESEVSRFLRNIRIE
ncbi:kynurenine formamidase [Drosophila rhopaloa]|uniref:Kynurenine formamidase n=1 Tax=Drosophila rhopaloa TaxID=1041015 RepID=A0A6P4EXK7_DRORH|nr:kynurenine formamidase [Drosophila rhopaloa]XP_016982885.1 kynurenine formamidase [Drosophila rhopaloa]